MKNTRIEWSKIPYIPYDVKNDACLSEDEKAEIFKAFDQLVNERPGTERYKYLSKRIDDLKNYVYQE